MPQPPSIAAKFWDDESALWDVFPVQRWYLCVLPRSAVQTKTTQPSVSLRVTPYRRENSWWYRP
jgi:hypothetical protein